MHLNSTVVFSILSVFSFFFHSSCYALDKSFFSITSTDSTPEFDNIFIPSMSVQYESSSFQELMYSSPESKKFSIQLAALIGDGKKINRIRAITSYKGMIFAANSGSIKGRFHSSFSSYFPDSDDVDDFIQDTLLPQKRTFNGDSEFWGIGKLYNDMIVGVGYQKVISPHLLSIDVPFSVKSYEEGYYPSKAIDAEGKATMYGLWMRYDPIWDAFKMVQESNQPLKSFFYSWDLLIGIAHYSPGSSVSADYAYATERLAASNGYAGRGIDLNVSSAGSGLFNFNVTYGIGYQAIYPIKNMILGASIGFEGSYSHISYDFDSSHNFLSDDATGTVDGSASSEINSVFIRFAVAY